MDLISSGMMEDHFENTTLHWNYRGFVELPPELIKYGRHICELYLKFNSIERLPDWLDKLSNLTNIYLQANCLKRLPEVVCELVNLEILDVSHNKLDDIPLNIGKMKKLKKLILTKNCLTNLPNSLGELESLVSLQVNGNSLQSLPYSLSRCTTLEELCVDCNQLSSLPNFLARLPNLQSISACRNRLSRLPLHPFVSLKRFYFDSNGQLSVLPYPLACQLNRIPRNPLVTRGVLYISCYGCFRGPPNPNHVSFPVRRVDHQNAPYYVNIPSFLQLSESVVPTLSELVLRSLIAHLFRPVMRILCDPLQCVHHFELNGGFFERYDPWVRSLSSLLPLTLLQLLQEGPIAFCFHDSCSSAIFRCGHPVIVPKILIQNHVSRNVVLENVLCCIPFCSQVCLRAFRNACHEPWEMEMLDSRIEWIR